MCLTKRVPIFGEFFAYEFSDLVNTAIMYFGPNHPIMLLCLDEARKLGRTVRWGRGPRLLTRILKKRGCLDQALSASVCYPINPAHAPEALRPGAATVLTSKIEPSLFLHLWNSILISAWYPEDVSAAARFATAPTD